MQPCPACRIRSRSFWSAPAISPTVTSTAARAPLRPQHCSIRIPGTVFTVGDHAYPSGTAKEFRDCYDASWGRHKARTRPAPGNHDYITAKAKAYYDYFGDSAGPDRRGYYSYTLGAWHVVSLNSFIAADRGSPQIEWLRKDLKDNRATCTLAYWHIPVFSSGPHGSDVRTSAHMLEAWRVLYEFGADVVINGHDHDYERFAPQDPKGKADPAGRQGIRRRHGRRRHLRFQADSTEQRGAQQSVLRGPEVGAGRHGLHLGFRVGRR